MKRISLVTLLTLFTFFSKAQQNGLKLFDIVLGGASSTPTELTVIGDKLYFFADEKLYSLDTAEQLSKIADLKPVDYPTNKDGVPSRSIVEMNNNIYLLAENNSSETAIYKLDKNGTVSQETILYKGTFNYSGANFLTPHNGKLYFSMASLARRSLFVFNPANKELTQLTDSSKSGMVGVYDIVSYKDRLYFTGGLYKHPNSGLFTYDPSLDISWQVDWDTLANVWDRVKASKLVIYKDKLYYFNSGVKRLKEYDGINKPKAVSNIIYGNNNNLAPYKDTLYYNRTTDMFYTTILDNNFYIAQIGSIGIFDKFDGNTFTRMSITADDCFGIASFNGKLYVSMQYYDIKAGAELYRIYPEFFTNVNTLETNNIVSKAYPNPVQDVLSIQVDFKQSKTLSVTLTDMQGKVVYRSQPTLYSQAKHTITIPMQNLPAGNYIYSLYNNNSLVSTGKIAKQ